MSKYLLEINLISAQQLKFPRIEKISNNLQTYAVAWIYPDEKLKSRIDTAGRENPTWNDKFMFMVDDELLNEVTSCLVIEIYCVTKFKKIMKDKLIGTTRILLNNLFSYSNRYHEGSMIRGTFRAFHVRLPSGEPQGILNIGINVIDGWFMKKKSYILDYQKLINSVSGNGDDHDHGDFVKKATGVLESLFAHLVLAKIIKLEKEFCAWHLCNMKIA